MADGNQEVEVLNLQREPGYLYFLRGADVYRSPMKGGKGKSELVAKGDFEREKGYLYFLDKQGNVARVAQSHGRKAPKGKAKTQEVNETPIVPIRSAAVKKTKAASAKAPAASQKVQLSPETREVAVLLTELESLATSAAEALDDQGDSTLAAELRSTVSGINGFAIELHANRVAA